MRRMQTHAIATLIILFNIIPRIAGQCNKLQCQQCVTNAACAWCDPTKKIASGSKVLDMGYCSDATTECDASKYSAFATLFPIIEDRDLATFELKKVTTSADCSTSAAAKRNSAVRFEKSCGDCVKESGAEWCQLDIQTTPPVSILMISTGGVCLNTSAAAGGVSIDCEMLNAIIKARTARSLRKGECPPRHRCAGASCEECRGERCVWCSLRVEHKDKKTNKVEYNGTPLGVCRPMKAFPGEDVCKGITFGEYDKVQTYTLEDNEYKTEVVPYAPSSGWTRCTADLSLVDYAVTLKNCSECTQKKKQWCKLSSKDEKGNNKVGGVCARRRICEQLRQYGLKSQREIKSSSEDICTTSSAFCTRISSAVVGALLVICLSFL